MKGCGGISRMKSKNSTTTNAKKKKKTNNSNLVSGVNNTAANQQSIKPTVMKSDITRAEIDAVLNDRAIRLSNYIASVLEPELTVTDGLIAKQPSLFPIPSTSVSFRDNLTLSTDTFGDFAIAWNPNFFSNMAELSTHKFLYDGGTEPCNTVCRIVQKRNNGTLVAFPSYVPDVALSKYRLVSAKIKVTYVGSILNKSGMMYACATYDQTPVFIGVDDSDGEEPLSIVDSSGTDIHWNTESNVNSIPGHTYANLTERVISNGIWNKSLNITNSEQGISCHHVPTDPINEIFYPIGTYFGNLGQNSQTVPRVPSNVTFGNSLYSTQGAQLCYLICGHGLPADQECINIQVYYTFEVIPTTSTAPFLRSLTDKSTAQEREFVRNIVREVSPQIAITTQRPRNLWSSIRDMMRNVDWKNVAMSAASLVPKIAKLF